MSELELTRGLDGSLHSEQDQELLNVEQDEQKMSNREQEQVETSQLQHQGQSDNQPSVALLPPEDAVSVTADGGVLMQTLTPGDGNLPPLHARCLVHFVGRLAPSGEVFMNSATESQCGEPKKVVAGRDSSAQETGLSLAVARMSRGERARVWVQDAKYGYGDRGSFSFPHVPPRAQLVYDVDMISWEDVPEDEDGVSGLLYEERIERTERRRLQGNQLFKEGKLKEALNVYAMALSYIDEEFMMQLDGPYLDKAEAIKLPIHLNMAAVQLKMGDCTTAIYNCTQVLNMEAKNVKALFRRGKAKHTLGQTEEALIDLEQAYKIDPSDKGILAELHAVRATIKRERAAQSNLFKGKLAHGIPGGDDDEPTASSTVPQPIPEGQQAGAGAASSSGHLPSSEIEPAGDAAPSTATGKKTNSQRGGKSVSFVLNESGKEGKRAGHGNWGWRPLGFLLSFIVALRTWLLRLLGVKQAVTT